MKNKLTLLLLMVLPCAHAANLPCADACGEQNPAGVWVPPITGTTPGEDELEVQDHNEEVIYDEEETADCLAYGHVEKGDLWWYEWPSSADLSSSTTAFGTHEPLHMDTRLEFELEAIETDQVTATLELKVGVVNLSGSYTHTSSVRETRTTEYHFKWDAEKCFDKKMRVFFQRKHLLNGYTGSVYWRVSRRHDFVFVDANVNAYNIISQSLPGNVLSYKCKDDIN